MYLPKSKYTGNKYTAGNQLVYSNNNQPYVGPYFETYLGEYYSGDSPTSNSRKLEPVVVEGTTSLVSNQTAQPILERYDTIRRNSSEFRLKETLPVPMYYPRPNTGTSFERYFAIDKNTQRVVEVSKDTYLSMKSKEPKYYYPKYDLKTLTWSLTNASENRINAAVAGLDSYLKDPSQFVR